MNRTEGTERVLAEDETGTMRALAADRTFYIPICTMAPVLGEEGAFYTRALRNVLDGEESE
jgi:hypothetical protein